MRIFISGGCKNGKSYYAQCLAKKAKKAKEVPLYYIATMAPVDGEDNERIARHRKEREGWGFKTIEQPRDIENILQKCDTNGSFLLDSLTALLANEMFQPAGKSYQLEKISAGLSEILNRVNDIVVVSDYIYSDAEIYEPLTEEYRKSLAVLDRLAAKLCDAVLEVSYTNVIIHKGKGVFDEVS